MTKFHFAFNLEAMMRSTLLSLLLSISLLLSCQTITVRPDGGAGKLSRPPDWQKTQHFFMGGLVGEAALPVGEICQGGSAAQLQSQTTFLNSIPPILGAWLGAVLSVAFPAPGVHKGNLVFVGTATAALIAMIWTPKTAKVWCEEGGKPLSRDFDDNKSKLLWDRGV